MNVWVHIDFYNPKLLWKRLKESNKVVYVCVNQNWKGKATDFRKSLEVVLALLDWGKYNLQWPDNKKEEAL